MRVVNSSMYRKFTSGVNNAHANLIKSYNKVSSGEAYEKAAENPLAHYRGKKIDDQFQESLAKTTLIKDVKNRLYQQELGAYDIQTTLAAAKNQVQRCRTGTTSDEALMTLRDDLLQKMHTVVNDLNAQYENFYVFGGNDISTSPFSLSADGTTLTFNHKYPGEQNVTTITMKLTENADGTWSYKDAGISGTTYDSNGNAVTLNAAQAKEKLLTAMKEQGRMDLGYGSIHDRSTLMDTYTGGLNVLTGLNSDAVIAGAGDPATDPNGKDILDYLNESAVALIGQAVLSVDSYKASGTGDKTQLYDVLGKTIEQMTQTEHTISTVYSDLGNKYKALDDTQTKMKKVQDSMQEQYNDLLGADPYMAIMEMFNNQYSYNAALQVGSNLMNTSLFDFMR
ncbi:MAG: flagellar hook-basal body protein [Lachnospiraceae bacterium]|nr:flagellar hook-basal body protein [Lachnospiraceae bacterium]